jgi:hypothetical protein
VSTGEAGQSRHFPVDGKFDGWQKGDTWEAEPSAEGMSVRLRRNLRAVGSAISFGIVVWLASPADAVPVPTLLHAWILFGSNNIASMPQEVAMEGFGNVVVNGAGPIGHLSSLSVPAGALTQPDDPFGNSTATIPTTGSNFEFRGYDIASWSGNQAGTFMGSGGAIPLAGSIKVCLFLPCSTSPPANLNVPLSMVGKAGAAAYPGGAAAITVQGAPWTTGTAVLSTGATLMGFRHGPASGTSSTVAFGGQLQLVTPIMISTNISPTSILRGFGVMVFTFTPEPGTLVLLTSGLAALGLGERRRRRRSG